MVDLNNGPDKTIRLEPRWVRTTSFVQFPIRASIATFGKRELFNAGAADEHWSRLFDLEVFDEALVFRLLVDKYGAVASHWSLEEARWDMKSFQYEVLVTHPDFPATELGESCPYIDLQTGMPE